MLEADEVAAAARERIVERRRGHRGAHAASRRRPRLRHLRGRRGWLSFFLAAGCASEPVRSGWQECPAGGVRGARCACVRACVRAKPSSWWLAGCNASVQRLVGWLRACLPLFRRNLTEETCLLACTCAARAIARSPRPARPLVFVACATAWAVACPHHACVMGCLGLLPSCRTAPKQKLSPPGLVGAASAHTQRALLLRCAAPTHSRFLHRQYRRARR